MFNAPNSVVATLAAPGLTLTPQNVSLRQETGNHTLALVSLPADTTSLLSQRSTIPDGTPVTLTWGKVPGQTTVFYGYVHHHESSSDNAQTPTLTYVLIGTSQVLNDHTSRTWKGVTGSYVARQIASAAGLSVYCHKTGTPDRYLAQASQSDFTFLNGLAELYGCMFWVDGPNMLMLNKRVLLDNPVATNMPRASLNRRPSQMDTLLSFKMVQGPTVPGSGQAADRTTYGLSKTTGKIIKATTSTDVTTSPRQLVDTSQPVGSYATAAKRLAATAANNDQWVVADAEMVGDIRLHPGGLVWLDGIAMPAGSQGAWLVEKAEHLLSRIDRPTYSTRLRLTRNTATGQALNQVLGYGADNGPQTCVLDGNGHWRATVIKEVTYGL